MSDVDSVLEQLCINTTRMLAVDAINKANSGHPGLPLGATPMTHVLWDRFLKHSPAHPEWFNRDRFILSAGHGCAMLYALLHLHGYDLSLEEIKNFRQWGSKTPGHPEYGLTPGVEATTGPLGQGFSMGVGMAIAERYLAGRFNRESFSVIDHYTYAVVSDGDLMEGVACEAASLAGTLGLGKLIYLYDDNEISIEGDTDLSFLEDVGRRFESYRWDVLKIEDGNNTEEIARAIQAAQAVPYRPSLIIIKTHIGYGSPKQDTASVHGSPLGSDPTIQTKEFYGWPQEPHFHIPVKVKNYFENSRSQGQKQEARWNNLLGKYREAYPELAEELCLAMEGKLPPDWEKSIPNFSPESGAIATRNASGEVINAIGDKVGYFLGGSADLAPSTMTTFKKNESFSAENRRGRNFHFGIREHAMAAAVNGMALHKGVIPFGATFLVFADYMKPSLRLAALMETQSLFVFTHDSICLGEDGPTHQAVEQLMSLRAIPGFTVIRPADANETAAAWQVALQSKGPVALALTRQKLPILSQETTRQGLPHGAYILSDSENPALVIIATGSEVHLALSAQKELAQENISVRVVSMPCWELFEQQSTEYQNEVLPLETPRLIIEAGIRLGWERYVGKKGDIIALDRFGASAPWQIVYEKLGFNMENVVEKAKALLV